MREIRIDDKTTIVCETKSTRSGTREWAYLLKDGDEVERDSYFWSNRPWQEFTYAEAIRGVLQKSEYTKEEQDAIYQMVRTGERERVDQMFGSVAMVAKLGELLTDNKKDRNDWKARMLKAGLNLEVPSDWDQLSEDEKERRLNGALSLAGGDV